MSANIANQVSYLRTSREFPTDEVEQLSIELSKAYIDIANSINSRIIGIFSINKSSVTGEAWYLTSQKQQSFRRVYIFTTTSDIQIGFKISSISQFSRCWGVYTDGTSWYGIIFGTSVAIPGQISFYITVDGTSTTSDLIKFVVDGAAPVLSSGKIILEWLSNP